MSQTTEQPEPWTLERLDARLAECGIQLPEVAAPVASYRPWRVAGDMVFVSGQIPIRGGEILQTGRVPDQVDTDRATECARVCCLNGLAAIRDAMRETGRSLSHMVRIGCFVASEPGFGGQPQIANGASDLLAEVLGDSGRHARAAVGSVGLPLNVPVEIEFAACLSAR